MRINEKRQENRQSAFFLSGKEVMVWMQDRNPEGIE